MAENKYYITPQGNEIIIREGSAQEPLKLKEPNVIHIAGDIRSVSTFIKGRQNGHSSQAIDTSKAIVEVSKDSKKIKLSLDPENYYGSTVTATLTAATDLAPFGINQEKRFTRKDLHKQLKFSKYLFEDKASYELVCSSLVQIRMKTDTEINQMKDNKGNSTDNIETRVSAPENFPKSFILTIPIFKGFPAEKIEVEICYDVLDGAVSFWLESIGLRELMDSKIDDIFKKELENCDGFVIIYN